MGRRRKDRNIGKGNDTVTVLGEVTKRANQNEPQGSVSTFDKFIILDDDFVDEPDKAEEDRIATEIIELTTRMNQVVALTVLEIGKRLVAAKRLVRHGEWANWLKQRVNYSQRTANNYMKLYREYGETGLAQDSQSIANLSYTQALAILDAPNQERERLAEEVASKDMTIRELKETIRNIKEQAEATERSLAASETTTAESRLANLEERQVLTTEEAKLGVLMERTLDDYAQALDVIKEIGQTDRVQALRLFDGLDAMLTQLHDKAERWLRS